MPVEVKSRDVHFTNLGAVSGDRKIRLLSGVCVGKGLFSNNLSFPVLTSVYARRPLVVTHADTTDDRMTVVITVINNNGQFSDYQTEMEITK